MNGSFIEFNHNLMQLGMEHCVCCCFANVHPHIFGNILFIDSAMC